MKIQHKLTVVMMLTCTISLVLAGVVFIAWGYNSSRKSMTHNLLTQAEMIADNCKASVTFDDPKDAKETLRTLRLEPSIVQACIHTTDGREFASYYREDIDSGIHYPSEILADGYSFNDGMLSVSKSIVVDDTVIASVWLRSDLQPLYAALIRNIGMVAFVLLCVSLIAWLLSVKLQGIISKPILNLTKVARKISENKEYSVRVAKQSNDETGLLIDSFNEMLEQIQNREIQLVEINENLEEKVNKRTCELTKEITEHKKTEEILRQEHNFSQSIVETAQTIMLILDTEGRIVSFNPYMKEICGYRLEEVKGKGWFETFFPQRDWQHIRKLFKKAVGGIQTHGKVNPIVTKDGREVEIEWYDKTLKDINGNITGLLAIGHDVTKQRQYEEALKLAKIEADAANQAKSQFLANMSHEIRTPMNAIIGFSDLLADEDLTDEQKQEVNLIRESSHNLLRLINDILDFSKIEAGQLDTEIIDCSLAKVLNSVESLMRPKATEKGLEFEVVESNGLPAQIRSDPTRLQQCLINLVGNSIKFTKQGHVYVNISLEDKDGQPYIRFGVEDTGIGIPKDKQAKVFDSFTQADGDTTRKYGGTGLGLTITKQLAELLGGELTLTSEEGKGTTFSLTIPANIDVTKQPFLDKNNIASHTTPVGIEVEQPEFSGNILVAEDVPTNQMLIKSLLKRLGLQVTIAEDGNEALQKAMTGQFDLIFMDIQMPRMNGYEATKELRKKGIETPIIALTANAMSGDEEKCICVGCNDFLAKPIDRRQLLEKLRKYLPLDGQTLLETVDTVKSQVDELSELCSNQNTSKAQSSELAKTDINSDIINWDQLIGRLRDEALIEEIVPIFLKDSKELFDNLSDAMESGDTKAIKFYCHSIKGAVINVGAEKLSDIASKLESAGREGDLDSAVSIHKELKTEYEKVVSFLSQPDWIQTAKNNNGQKDKENRPLINNLNKHT